jgi:hypothetical protein
MVLGEKGFMVLREEDFMVLMYQALEPLNLLTLKLTN